MEAEPSGEGFGLESEVAASVDCEAEFLPAAGGRFFVAELLRVRRYWAKCPNLVAPGPIFLCVCSLSFANPSPQYTYTVHVTLLMVGLCTPVISEIGKIAKIVPESS